MFPIIPALILLLLHGPSSFERLMALDGWPSGSEAIVRASKPNQTEAAALRDVVAAVCAALQPDPPVELAEPADRTTNPTDTAPIGDGVTRYERARDGPQHG